MDVQHVRDVGLGRAGDDEVVAYACRYGRIVVTRNYADFVRLLEAYRSRDRLSPGVLFLSPSLPQRDAGAHVRALLAWMESAAGVRGAVQGSYGWLSAEDRER